MKKFYSILLVVTLICISASASSLRPVCTIDEFLYAQTTSDYMLNGEFKNLIFKDTLSRIQTGDFDGINIPVYDGQGYYILITPKDSEKIYMLAYALSTEADDFDKTLRVMTTAVLMAAGMQKEVFDVTFDGMNGLGLFRSTFDLGDSGEYRAEGCSARWEVIDKDGIPAIKLSIVND